MSPTCEVCMKQMWWHGSTDGWGCPNMHGGSPDCRSALYRPKRNLSKPWPYGARYPELRADASLADGGVPAVSAELHARAEANGRPSEARSPDVGTASNSPDERPATAEEESEIERLRAKFGDAA